MRCIDVNYGIRDHKIVYSDWIGPQQHLGGGGGLDFPRAHSLIHDGWFYIDSTCQTNYLQIASRI